MKTIEELRESILMIVDTYKENKTVIKYMQEIYVQKNLPLMTVGIMFKQEKAIHDLNDIELGIWCYYLYQTTKDNMLKPIDYLTELEIYNIKTYINQDPLNIKTDEIVLQNVIKKIVKGKVFFSCNIDFYDIYKAQENSLITYNFDTQRNAKMFKKNGKICKRENINLTSVDEIKQLTIEDELPPSMITWNLRQTPNWQSMVFYDETIKTLKVKPNFDNELFIDNIDGYHRTIGIVKGVTEAIELNKQLEGYMQLSITTFDVDKAQNYIHIQNKQNTINAEHIESFAKNDINDFIKMINYEGAENTNIMYEKIVNTIDELQIYEDKYTTFGIMHDGFRLAGLKIDKPRKVDKNLKYFIEIFNNILGYYEEKYNYDIKKLKQETIVLKPNIFVGYIAIGMALYDIENPIDMLNTILETDAINLSRNYYDWHSIDMFRNNVKSYKKIYDYFYNLTKDILG